MVSTRWSALTGLVCVIVAASVLPANAATSVAVSSTATCPSGVPGSDAASVAAAACGGDVEVLSERSEWSTVWATPSGSFRQEMSATAVRTRVSGEWGSIDTTIAAGPEGLSPVAPVWPMTFSDGSPDAPLASINRDGYTLTLGAPIELTEPVVEGSSMTYPAVLPGVDLVVSVNDDGTGFTQVLRVDSPEAAANPALASLEFPLETSEGLTIRPDGRGFEAVGERGLHVFTSPAPRMWDSAGSGDGRSGATARRERSQGPAEGDRIKGLTYLLGSGRVTVTPDEGMLTDPGTVWPIFLDPGVSGDLAEWTQISSAFDSDYKFSDDAGVGFCDVSADYRCNQDNRKRLIWEFHDLGTVSALSSDQVISATFSAYGTWSWACENRTVNLYRVPGIGSSTTWGNHASSWTSDRFVTGRYVHHKPGCSTTPRWIEFNVTSVARYMATNNDPNVTIGLRADSETCMSCGWKHYRNDARLSVEYNRAPSTPTGLRTTSPTTKCVSGQASPYWLRDRTPTLRATLSDPDRTSVRGEFDVRSPGGSVTYWNPGLTTGKSSGSEHAIGVPSGTLSNNKEYEWRVRGVDSAGLTSTYRTCDFGVDLTAPPKPDVTPVAGQPAVYYEDQWAGGAGKLGKFKFTSSGAGDVKKFKYSFNSDSLGSTVTASNVCSDTSSSACDESATVSFTPTRVGSQTLYVQAVDKAGWTSSSVRLFRFKVEFPETGVYWGLNEGSGTQAYDPVQGVTLSWAETAATWVNGPKAESGLDPSDRALQFSGALSGYAATNDPVVATDSSYTVMAAMKLTGPLTDTSATAVSQGGYYHFGFKLGATTNSACQTPDNVCWAFWTTTSDDASGSLVRALSSSTEAIVEDQWVHLTGIYDADRHEMSLTVCSPLGSSPAAPATVSYTSTWAAGGRLRLGTGLYAGATRSPFPGVVDEVRIFDSIVDADTIYRACKGQDPLPPNEPPTATLTGDCDGLACDLDGSASSDADGSIASYRWDYGDGIIETTTTPTVMHSYASAGSYTVTVTVTDDDGGTDTTTMPITATASVTQFRAAASAQENTAFPDIAVPTDVQAGDGMLLFLSTAADVELTPPVGWSVVGQVATDSMLRTWLLQKVATASDAGSLVTAQLSLMQKVDLQLLVYSGTNSVGPVVVDYATATTADATAHTTPTLTTSAAGLVVSYWCARGVITDWLEPEGEAVRSEFVGAGEDYMASLVTDPAAPASAGASVGGLTASTDIAGWRATAWTVVLSNAG